MAVKRIMHASDFSKASTPAFRLARDLAKALRAELILCHAYEVVTPLTVSEGFVLPRVLDQMWRAARTSAGSGLDRLVAQARRDRVTASPATSETARLARSHGEMYSAVAATASSAAGPRRNGGHRR